jgi:hypothetical protein
MHHRDFHDARWRNPAACCFAVFKSEDRSILTCSDGSVVERTKIRGNTLTLAVGLVVRHPVCAVLDGL